MQTLIRLLAVFTFSGAVIGAAENPSFRFESKIGLPALSLLDNAKENSLPILNDAAQFFRSEVLHPLPARKFVSTMPIIAPNPAIDHKLRVVAPDDSVDYTLMVKSPEIEVAR